jgi:hypothetical protein
MGAQPESIRPMKHSRHIAAAGLLLASQASIVPTHASAEAPPPATVNLSGLHDFDFLVGDWRVHHFRIKERLAGSSEWSECEGTCSMRPLMGGRGNVDDNVINVRGEVYRGVGLRAYDSKTAQWAIWWLDGRNPFADLAPPMIGHFQDGVGVFYGNDTLRGKPILARYIWTEITRNSAHWEQAFSPDGGKTWETNWKMELTRVN